MDLGLTDAAALVTASSSGLGKATALALAREGANVAICARNAERLEAARSEINDTGPGDVLAVQTDVTDPDDLDELIEEVTADFGGLDHLVVSTGSPAVEPFAETFERDWYVTYDVLVMSLVRLAKLSHPFLVESDAGSMTAIASTEAREPVPDDALSSVIRPSVTGLVKTLAGAWAPDVRVNAVLPGPHETPGLHTRIEAAVERGQYDSSGAGLDDVRDAVPLGRLGEPEAFGELTAVLASQSAQFVTGAAVPIDGGVLRG